MIVVLFQKSANFSEGCTATISTVYVKPVKQHEQTSVHGPDPAVSYAKKEKKKRRPNINYKKYSPLIAAL